MVTANTHTHSLTYTDTRLHMHPLAHPHTHTHTHTHPRFGEKEGERGIRQAYIAYLRFLGVCGSAEVGSVADLPPSTHMHTQGGSEHGDL